MKNKTKINSDAPCRDLTKEDCFEREHFVKMITNFLALPPGSPSQVIALNAPWGYGKTTVINFIKNEIKSSNHDYLVMDFSPWLIGHREKLIQAFLLQLASTLKQDKRISKAAEALIDYTLKLGPWAIAASSLLMDPSGLTAGAVIKSIDIGGKISKQINNNLKDFDLDNAKEKAKEAINNTHKQILVVIDDIDRLPPDEIRTIMQLVKAVADFDNINYLLAFEEKPVIEALSYNGLYDGRRYLEKIVHLEYHLPKLNLLNKKTFFEKRLQEILERNQIELSVIETQILNELLTKTSLIRILDTPREINRLYSKILTTSFILKDEVCFADIVAWEAIQMKFPEIAKQIKNRPDWIMGDFSFDENPLSEDEIDFYAKLPENDNEQIQTFKDILIKDIDDERRKIETRIILDFLFIHESKRHRNPEFNIINRISNNIHLSKDIFWKILFGGLTHNTISIAEINEFCNNPDIRNEIFLSYYNDNQLSYWLNALKRALSGEKKNIVDTNNLVELFISFELSFPKNREINESFATVLYAIYQNQQSDTKNSFVNKILESNNFSLSAMFISELLEKNELYDTDIYIPIDDFIKTREISSKKQQSNLRKIDVYRQKWVDYLNKNIRTFNIFTKKYDYENIISKWGQLNMDYTPVQNYIENLVKNERISFPEIIELYYPNSYNFRFGFQKIEKYFPNISEVIIALESLRNSSESQKKALQYFKTLKDNTIENNNNNESINTFQERKKL